MQGAPIGGNVDAAALYSESDDDAMVTQSPLNGARPLRLENPHDAELLAAPPHDAGPEDSDRCVSFVDVNAELAPPTERQPLPDGASMAPGLPLRPSGRSGSFAFATDSEVLIYGGLHSDTELLNEVWAYNPTKRTWRFVPAAAAPGSNMPPPSFGPCATVLGDGTLFVLGGQVCERFPAAAAHHFSPQTGLWRDVRLFHAPRSTTDPGPVPDVHRWGGSFVNVPRVWWQRLLGPKVPIAHVLDVLLLFAGDGRRGNRDVLLFWRDRTQVDAWHVRTHNAGPSHLEERRRQGVALYQDEFVLMFGGRHAHAFHMDLWVYSISANNWMQITRHTNPSLLQLFFACGVRDASSLATRQTGIELQRAIAAAINKNNAQVPPSSRPRWDLPNVSPEMLPALGATIDPDTPWPMPRTGVACFMLRDDFIVTSGFTVAYDAMLTFNDVWAFSLRTASWRQLKPNDIFDGAIRHRVERMREAGCLGPPPHSMSAVCPLPGAPLGTFFLHGGRAGDVALEDAFTVKIDPPAPLTLVEVALRRVAASRLRSLLDSELKEAASAAPSLRGAVGRRRTAHHGQGIRAETLLTAFRATMRDIAELRPALRTARWCAAARTKGGDSDSDDDTPAPDALSVEG